MMLLSFLKGLKLETILFGLVATAAALTIAYAVYLKQSLRAAEADLALEQFKRQGLEQKLTEAVETFDRRMNDIKALEESRKTARLDVEPLRQRVEEVSRKNDHASENSVVDRLNRLNADANRMLEQNSR